MGLASVVAHHTDSAASQVCQCSDTLGDLLYDVALGVFART